MKKLSLLAGILLLSATVFSEVGYINTNVIYQKYSKARKFITELDKIKQSEEAKIAIDNKKFQEQVEALQKKGDKATDADRAELKKAEVELNKKLAVAKESFKKEDISREQIISSEILEAATSVAKIQKLDVIVNSQTVVAGGKDVTSAVIETLEKNLSKKK